MREVFTAIKAAASSSATILIQGESGTGKELVAGAIHYNSPFKDKPLVTVNCSALSESLLESELFGHVKGAFTGAIRDRKGRFEEAHGGTVFLDEIGEISPLIQVKLLRVLQEREVERVGESRKRKVDIRVTAATHQDLYRLVKEGRFREDLYYRLKVFPIHIPPLRKRKDDIPLLVSHFIDAQNQKTGKSISGVTQSSMRIIMDYSWPGNVRELENAIEHAFVLCNEDQIDLFDLPVEIRQMPYQPAQPQRPSFSPPGPRARKKLTKTQLTDLLHACEWNKAEVARQVGLSRTAIWKYMKKWNIPLKAPERD
jgi:transcriptional regulator with GAF, ATPase, and Fis domain